MEDVYNYLCEEEKCEIDDDYYDYVCVVFYFGIKEFFSIYSSIL